MTKNRLITSLILFFFFTFLTASIKAIFSFVPTGASPSLMSNDTEGERRDQKRDGGSF